MVNRFSIKVLVLAGLSCSLASAQAGIIREYNAPVAPASTGFTPGGFGSFSEGPLNNDLGRAAWRTTGNTLGAQRPYLAGGFSTAELNDIAANGFTMTFDGRAIRNIGGSHTASNPRTLTGFSTNFNGRRWDVALGLDASDNTVAILSNSIDVGGGGGAVRNFGSHFVVSGNGYNRYQLVYDPIGNNADFFINGTKVFDDYAGTTSFVGNWSLGWGVHGGGQGNVSFVQLASGDTTSVPEPTTFALLSLLAPILVGNRRRRSS